MAFWRTHQLYRQDRRVLTSMSVLRPVLDRGSLLSWIVVTLVGIALGIATLGASALPSKWTALFIMAVLCPFIVMIIGNVRRLLLALIILDIPLQLDINLGYNAEAAKLGALGGWNISLTTICLLVLYVLWLIGLFCRVGPQARPRLRETLPLAGYPAFVMLSVMVATDVTLSLFEVFLLVQMFLLYLYIVSWVRTRQDVLFVVSLLVIGLVFESLIMIGVYLSGRDINLPGISTQVDPSFNKLGQISRIGGTLRSPNGAASYLSLLLAPAISLVLTPLGRWYKQLGLLAFGLGAVALILTLSRGGWIAFGLSTSILCLLAWHRGWLRLTLPLTIIVVALLLALPFQNTVLTRLLGSDEGSAYSRIPLMQLALKMISDHPLFGIGANNFAIMIKQYATPEFDQAWLYVVHNSYLRVWAETGIGGLVAFIVWFVTIIRRGWQCWRVKDRFLSPIALGFTAAIIGHMIHTAVDLFNGRLQAQLLWLIAGLITAMGKIDRQSWKCK